MTGFAYGHADTEREARASFARQGLMTTLGAGIVSVAPGVVVLAADFREGLSQQHGFFHAGVTASLADSAAGYAAFTLFPAGSGVLTVEFKINLMAPAKGSRLIATGRVERSGRTLTVCRADVSVIDGARETAVATGLYTMMRMTNVAG